MNKKAAMVLRIITGLVMVVFGAMGLIGVITNSIPALDPQTPAGAFNAGLMASGYFFYFLKITEILVGIALLINRYVPLALVILAPLSINFVLFHLFLDLAGIAPGLAIFILNIVLAVHYKEYYKKVLVAKA